MLKLVSSTHAKTVNTLIITHLTLRKLLGSLGIAMPVILPLGAYLFGENPWRQPSISDYYYTGMRDVFVGILWGFGLFLFSYKGYKPKKSKLSDNVITNIAGILAIGISLFPTGDAACENSCNPGWVGTVHLMCAAFFFLILGYISIFKFTKSDKPVERQTEPKKRRNILYIICGSVIWLSMAVLFSYFLFFSDKWPVTTVYWFEAFSLWAFGISWLVKGRALKLVGL